MSTVDVGVRLSVMDKLSPVLKKNTGAVSLLHGTTRKLNQTKLRLDEKFKRGKISAQKYESVLSKIQKKQRQLGKTPAFTKSGGIGPGDSLMDAAAWGVAAAGMAAPIKSAMRFESSMARVKALSGATEQEFDKLSSSAKKLGASTAFSASQVAEGQQYLAMAGFKTNQITKAMPGLLSLASAGQMDLASASDVSSNILSGFGIEASKMNNVSDLLAKTFTTANVDLMMLGETMKYVAPVASKAGVSIETAAAATGLLGNVGIQGSQAGTTLRAMISRLAAPSAGAAAKLAELGVETKDAAGNMLKFPAILKNLSKEMDGMGGAEKIAALKTIFGEEAASGATELVSRAGTGELDAYIQKLSDNKDVSQKISETQNSGLSGSLTKFSSATESLMISVSQSLLPILTILVGGVTWFVSGLTSLSDMFPILSSLVYGSVAAFISYKAAISAANLAGRILSIGTAANTTSMNLFSISTWRSRISLLRQSAASKISTAGMFASSLASKGAALSMRTFAVATKIAKSGVRGLMAASGIGLLLLGAGLIYEYWDPISEFFKSVFDKIKEPALQAWEFLKTVFEWSPLELFMKAYGAVFDYLYENFSWVKEMADGVMSVFGFGDESKSVAQKAGEPVSSQITKSGTGTSTINPTPTQPAEPAPPGSVFRQTGAPAQNSSSNSIQITFNGDFKISATDGKLDTVGLKQDLEQAVREALRKIRREDQDRSFSDDPVFA